MERYLVDSTLEHHQGSPHPHPLRLPPPTICPPWLSSTLLPDEFVRLSASPLLNYFVTSKNLPQHQPQLSPLLASIRILIALPPPWPPLPLVDAQALPAQPTQPLVAPASIEFPIAFSPSLLLLQVAAEPILLLTTHVLLFPVLAFVFKVLPIKLVVRLFWKPFLLFSSSFSFSSQLEVVAKLFAPPIMLTSQL